MIQTVQGSQTLDISTQNPKSFALSTWPWLAKGSVSGVALFIVYINYLDSANIEGTVTTFADDTALFYEGDEIECVLIQNQLSGGLQKKKINLLSDENFYFIKFRPTGDKF